MSRGGLGNDRPPCSAPTDRIAPRWYQNLFSVTRVLKNLQKCKIVGDRFSARPSRRSMRFSFSLWLTRRTDPIFAIRDGSLTQIHAALTAFLLPQEREEIEHGFLVTSEVTIPFSSTAFSPFFRNNLPMRFRDSPSLFRVSEMASPPWPPCKSISWIAVAMLASSSAQSNICSSESKSVRASCKNRAARENFPSEESPSPPTPQS